MGDDALGDPLGDFREVMRRLRAECPWKQAQTHRSLARYLLEETHETLAVLDASDGPGAGGIDDDRLRDELGDLLLQVFFHAAIAEERGAFDIGDVARSITAKMHRRNPHVFGPGDRPVHGAAADVDAAWQDIKATEGPPSELPETLPALLLAAKTLQRRTRAGAPAPDLPPDPDPDPGPDPGLDPGLDLGERLLALVAEAGAAGLDPEQALRDTLRHLPPPPTPDPAQR